MNDHDLMDEQREKSHVHDIGKARPGRYQIFCFCYSDLKLYYSSLCIREYTLEYMVDLLSVLNARAQTSFETMIGLF